MHRKSEAELLPLDTEIERTLKILRKTISAEDRSMANQIERLQTIPEEEYRGLIQWRNFGGPSSNKNTLL